MSYPVPQDFRLEAGIVIGLQPGDGELLKQSEKNHRIDTYKRFSAEFGAATTIVIASN